MMTSTQIRQSFLDFFKSKGRVVALLVSLLVVTTRAATPPSEFVWPNEALNSHLLYLQSNRYPALYIEVDAVEGAEPTESMLNKLDAFLYKHGNKPGGITIKRSNVIPRAAARGYTADALAAGYLDGPPVQTNNATPAFLYVLFYNNRVNVNVLQSPREAVQRPLKDRLPAAMSRCENPHVNFLPYPAMIYFDASYGPDLWEPKEFPELSLLHEAGHTLGLVSREGRIKTAHCAGSVCLMQPTLKMRYYVIPWLKDKRPKGEICNACDRELEGRRNLTVTNQMRFVGPVLVRTTPSYSVFTLPGNYGLYAADSIDDAAQSFLKQYKERFATSRGKMECWYNYNVQSEENLPTVVQAALEDPAPEIRQLARHMQKVHNVTLPERDSVKSIARGVEDKTN